MKRANPTWTSSAKPEAEEKLYMYNSFTKQKVISVLIKQIKKKQNKEFDNAVLFHIIKNQK